MDSIVKHEILRQIGETGVVAVIRARSPEEGIALGEALLEGGIRAVEVAMVRYAGVVAQVRATSDGCSISGCCAGWCALPCIVLCVCNSCLCTSAGDGDCSGQSLQACPADLR